MVGTRIVDRARLSIVLALAIVVAACSAPTPVAATAAPVGTVAAVDPFQAQWTALIDAAKKEGALTRS